MRLARGSSVMVSRLSGEAAKQRNEALTHSRERAHPLSTAITLDFATWLAQVGGNIRETFERADSAFRFASEQEFCTGVRAP